MSPKNRIITLAIITLTILSSSTTFALTREQMIDAHIRQLNEKLKFLDEADKNAIVRDFRQELVSYTHEELTNSNLMGQVKATITSSHIKTRAEQEARQYTQDPKKIESFAMDWSMRAINALEKNESLDIISRQNLKQAAQNYFQPQLSYQKPQNASYQPTPSVPTQPKPSAPSAQSKPYAATQQYNQTAVPRPLYYATAEDTANLTKGQQYLSELTPFFTNLSLRDQTRLEGFFFQSIQQNRSEHKIASHVQNAKLALFYYHLNRTHHYLSQEIDNPILQKAVQATADSISSTVRNIVPQQAKQFAHIIANLEETVLDNAGISCPVCTQTYKQSDTFGSVDKMQCQSPQGKQCQSVCTACAKNGSLNTCPTCRKGHINQFDLRKQEQTSANWRP